MVLIIMENNNLKKIDVSESLFQVKSKKQKNRTNKSSVSQLKPTTVKELLLQKLKQYKKDKTRKKKDMQPKLINSQDIPISSLTTEFLKTSKNNNSPGIPTPIINRNYDGKNAEPQDPYPYQEMMQHNQVQPQPPQLQTQLSQQPEYGNLKNGKKPTYRQYKKNKTMKKTNPNQVKVNIEKKFNVGKNTTQKLVGVFIKSNLLRRKIDDDKIELKKEKIKTIKNYLKTQNLIKYGSYAPNELLREMYSSSKLCGNVFNKSGKSLVHNYMNECS